MFCIYVSICSGWETFRSCELCALLRIYESEQCGNWIVKLFVLSIKTFEDAPSSQPRLHVCSARGCACMFICDIISMCNLRSIFPCEHKHVYKQLCRWVCVEFMRLFERELWSQLSVRPLTLTRTISFLISSLAPCPDLPSSTCHFPLLKGTAPPREVRKRGFLHIKLKRGLCSCSRLLPSGATSLVLVKSSESIFCTCSTVLKGAPFHLKYACGFV